MSFWSIALRVLLSLTLVLNGATAAASMHLQASHAEMAQRFGTASSDVGATNDAAPCHETAHATTPGIATHADASDGMATHAMHHAGDDAPSDCCKSGLCRCACVQATPAAIAELYVPALLPGTLLALPSLATGHGDPVLPSPIRPPIG